MQNIEIIYEDRHLVAVNKPSKVPVASEKSGDETLLDIVRHWNHSRQSDGKKGYCVPLHFLDRPVSGIILFAVSSKAASRLNEMFRERTMDKSYVAIVHGRPKEGQGKLEHWLIKDSGQNISSVVSPGHDGAKKCVLSYRVLDQIDGLSFVIVKPVTGRSHQIRVQFAEIGCPLVGDVKYGSKILWDGRIALHAYNLRFDHPVGGIPMSLSAPVPDYWRDVWAISFPRLDETT